MQLSRNDEYSVSTFSASFCVGDGGNIPRGNITKVPVFTTTSTTYCLVQ